jgi:outer membrane protein TolC
MVRRSAALLGAIWLASVVPTAAQSGGDLDSLALELQELDMRSAAVEAARTRFWQRLVPRIQFTAAFGVRDLVTSDLMTGAPIVIPRDSYRLTISLSISDLIDGSQHSLAQLKLARLAVERESRIRQFSLEKRAARIRVDQLKSDIASQEDELRLLDRIVSFQEAAFQQGSASFVTVARARIDVLNARRSLVRLRNQLRETGP